MQDTVRSRSLHVRLRPRRILRTGLVLQVGVLHALLDRDVELRLCVVDLSAPTQVDPDNVAVTVTRGPVLQQRSRSSLNMHTHHHFFFHSPSVSWYVHDSGTTSSIHQVGYLSN